jgi:hypothetical protein
MLRGPRFRMGRGWRRGMPMRYGPPLMPSAYMPIGPRWRMGRRWRGGCCLLPGCVLPLTFTLIALSVMLIVLL